MTRTSQPAVTSRSRVGQERPPRRRRAEAGISIVELTVAMALVAIALCSTMATVINVSALARTTRESRIAAREAESILEEVRSHDFDLIESDFHDRVIPVGTLGLTDPGAQSRVTVQQIANGSTRWRVLEVAVTVQWDSTVGPRATRFATYVTNRQFGVAAVGGGP